MTDHLLNNDLLGLNVLVSELLGSSNFDFASVYNSSNELLAQAGEASAGALVFTQQVTFQNVVIGYVQIAIKEEAVHGHIRDTLTLSVSVHAVLAFLLIAAGWFYGDMIYLWVVQPAHAAKPEHQTTTAKADGKTHGTKQPTVRTTVLVLKIRPERLRSTHAERIHSALALHAGEICSAQGDDIVVCYDNPDQLFQAICSGLLVLAMFRETTGITIKAGMHQVQDQSDKNDFEKVKKHASYLASISENQLLASRVVFAKIADSDHYECQPFHSSMTPDGAVFSVDALSNQALLENQARQLI